MILDGAPRPAISAWSISDIDVVTRAVAQAPSVRNTQPWRLELPDGEALLRQRQDVPTADHDPGGRDRTISCGAALANLRLAIRALGRTADVRLLPDPDQPDLVARVVTSGRSTPDSTELHRFSAIARRHSYRRSFADPPVPVPMLDVMTRTSQVDGVRLRHIVDGEETALAELLENAAKASQSDPDYQRKLALWINAAKLEGRGVGPSRATIPPGTVPWAGLIRTNADPAGGVALADRLARETLLLVVTAGDTPADHLRAGIAAEDCWLAAVDLGLAAAVITQPLRLPEVRSQLVASLDLAGHPQLLMRVGWPAGATA
jgi:hypothetical protein